MKMRRYIRAVLLVFVMSFGFSGVFGQGAPVQINDALAAFNAQIGGSLTLNDFYWEWSQETYPDASMGCPQPGQAYAQVETVGYKFLFTYNNEIYDFRVSNDRTVTVFCGKTPVGGEGDDSNDQVKSLSNSLCPAPTDTLTYPRTRLAIGIKSYVTPPLPNNIRDQPTPAGVLVGEIPGGATFDVISGPVCDTTVDGYVWWEVSYNGLRGWTAEARMREGSAEYYVEPQPPIASLPTTTTPIDATNMTSVIEVAQLQGNFSRDVAWSITNNLVTVGELGSEGVWVYAPDRLGQAPRIAPSVDFVTQVAFSTASVRSNIALLGDTEGSVRLWNLADGAETVERAFLQGHNTQVTAVAFSPSGDRIASSGGYAHVDEPAEGADANNYAIILWDVNSVTPVTVLRGHTADVVDMAFSANGAMLVSASADGSVRLWNVADGAELNALHGEIGATSVAFSPDGTRLFTGWADGVLIGITLAPDNTLTAAQPQAAHVGSVNDLAVSPSGGVIASVGDDGTITLWDAANVATAATGDVSKLLMVTKHAGAANGVAFNTDGSLIATIGNDHIIRLWGVVQTLSG